MKKFRMNKNVMHNKVSYAKHSEIGENDGAFKTLMAAGHVDTLTWADAPADKQAPVVEAVKPEGGEVVEASKSEEQSVAPAKPARQPGK